MKKIIFLLCLLPVTLLAGDVTQKIESPITSVVVYLTGAEVTHTKTVSISPGRNELHFVGLTSKLIPKSLQFTASGDVSVLAISDHIDYLYGQKKNDEHVKQLTDSLNLMSDNLAITRGQIDAYEKEKQMLDANQGIGGTNNGVVPADLKLSADFYYTRTLEINTELVKLNRKASDQQEVVNRLNWQLTEANQRTNPPMAEVVVLLNSTSTIKFESATELHYVVSDAGWAPSYDLIADDVSKPIDLKYRAKVFNNTDVDWKNVKMKLSTADPMQTAAAPQLDPWTLSFEQNNSSYYNNSGYGNTSGWNYGGNQPTDAGGLANQNLANSMPAQPQRAPAQQQYYNQNGNAQVVFNDKQVQQTQQIQYDQIQVSELSAEFDIKLQYDIPADGKPYIVDVTEYNLNATFQYHCVPKMEREAFLMARITGWEDLDLVEGPANVYFGGTYVGQSYIDTRSTDDTLDLSLGRDQKLVVTRTKLKEFNNEKSSATQKKETYSYEIDVKNTRKTAVTVQLQDQIPVSQDAEIIVDASQLSGGTLDPATGIVTWNLNIQPGETSKIVLTYTIKYPKNKVVNTRKFKTTSRAKF
ncbi:MAG TPA: DUF4139 domain-containing protein [Bacteroidia bacterium]|nr:DUF4139 domain-containing protein [Bacteroidia bacterium]